MSLPSFAPDKTTHFAYGAVISSLAATLCIVLGVPQWSGMVGLGVAAFFGAGKELSDYVINQREPGKHGVEWQDAAATTLGGLTAATPLLAAFAVVNLK